MLRKYVWLFSDSPYKFFKTIEEVVFKYISAIISTDYFSYAFNFSDGDFHRPEHRSQAENTLISNSGLTSASVHHGSTSGGEEDWMEPPPLKVGIKIFCVFSKYTVYNTHIYIIFI